MKKIVKLQDQNLKKLRNLDLQEKNNLKIIQFIYFVTGSRKSNTQS